jgi:hypothetical protein
VFGSIIITGGLVIRIVAFVVNVGVVAIMLVEERVPTMVIREEQANIGTILARPSSLPPMPNDVINRIRNLARRR